MISRISGAELTIWGIGGVAQPPPWPRLTRDSIACHSIKFKSRTQSQLNRMRVRHHLYLAQMDADFDHQSEYASIGSLAG
jgi:hypothetical protein